MIIAVDFDSTIVKHEFPFIGAEVPGAIEAIKVLQQTNKIILYTMRSGLYLKEAVKFCKDKGIKLWGVNNNPDQHDWTSSKKIYAHYYIDDSCIGVPLIYKEGKRPYVNWKAVKEIFDKRNLLEDKENEIIECD